MKGTILKAGVANSDKDHAPFFRENCFDICYPQASFNCSSDAVFSSTRPHGGFSLLIVASMPLWRKWTGWWNLSDDRATVSFRRDPIIRLFSSPRAVLNILINLIVNYSTNLHSMVNPVLHRLHFVYLFFTPYLTPPDAYARILNPEQGKDILLSYDSGCRCCKNSWLQ